MSGKGDKYRTVDLNKFGTNFDKIFSFCSEHPNYNGDNPPNNCIVCRRLWMQRQINLPGDKNASNL